MYLPLNSSVPTLDVAFCTYFFPELFGDFCIFILDIPLAGCYSFVSPYSPCRSGQFPWIPSSTFRHKWPTTVLWPVEDKLPSRKAGGSQTGSQGLTRRFVPRGEIWQHSVPTFGVAVGGKYSLPNGWGESCRDCCLSTSFRAYRSSCLAPQ